MRGMIRKALGLGLMAALLAVPVVMAQQAGGGRRGGGRGGKAGGRKGGGKAGRNKAPTKGGGGR